MNRDPASQEIYLLADYGVSVDEVHVWRLVLGTPAWDGEAVKRRLSCEEQRRADRFRAPLDRARYVMGRAVLRTIVAKCFDTSPKSLRFAYGPSGKPCLAAGAAAEAMQFNVSHSGDLILIALAIRRAVGIDVERIRSNIAAERIVGRFFSPSENKSLQSMPAEQRLAAFFDGWVRKEAYVKAVGAGLSIPLRDFDVSILPEEPRLLASRPDAREAQRWTLRNLDVGPGYKAALAGEGAGWTLKMFDWPPPAPAR